MIPLHVSAPLAELRVTKLCARCGLELGRERVSIALPRAYVSVHPACLSKLEAKEAGDQASRLGYLASRFGATT